MLIPCKPLSELTSSSVTNEFPFLLVELQAIDDCDLMETVCGSTKKRARESLSNTEKPKRRKKTDTNTAYFQEWSQNKSINHTRMFCLLQHMRNTATAFASR